MTTLSGIITPTNIVTATSTTTMTNKTINGSNNTVTNIPLSTGVTGTLPVANGGTGASTLTANNVLLGNGTSALQMIAPSTSGNLLTSNGTSWVSSTPAGGGTVIPSGTVMIFGQTSAPTGFTKDTTNYNNSSLRVVTGAASTGGSVDFTTAFVSQAVAGTVANTTLSTAQMPSHTHTGSTRNSGAGSDASLTGSSFNTFGSMGSEGSSSSHNHSFTGTAINLDVKYVDVIRATKD